MNHESPPQLPPDIDYQPPQPPQGLSSGAKWGIGCSIGCLFALLIGGIVAYSIYTGLKKVKDAALDTFSTTTPIVFTAPEADPATVTALLTRYDAFSDAMKTGADTGPLDLTGDEINLLIYHHPDWKELAGHSEVAIQDGQLSAQVSIPLEGIPLMGGRYVNGTAAIRLTLVDGTLEAYLDRLEVNGSPLPPEIMTELQKNNLFKDAQTNPELNRMILNLLEIRIDGGKLIIVPKPAAERKPPAEAPPTPAPKTVRGESPAGIFVSIREIRGPKSPGTQSSSRSRIT